MEAKYANLERPKPKEEVCKPSALLGALGVPLASAAVSKQPKFTLEDFERLSVPEYQMKRWNWLDKATNRDEMKWREMQQMAVKKAVQQFLIVKMP